ncbi:MAG: O-antigen polymerase [Bacteroidaceae bacterium]
MLIIVLIIFALMFGIGYYCSRSFFAPYTLMAGLWTIILSLYYILENNFFLIQNKFPIAILIWGVCFFVGSYFMQAISKSSVEEQKNVEPNNQIRRVFFVFAVVFMPIIICYSFYDAFIKDSSNFFLYLRMVNTGMDESIEGPQFGVLNYFVSLTFVLYLIELLMVTKQTKKKVYILFTLNLLLNIITMSKTSFFCLLISSIVILYFKGKIKIKSIFFCLLGFFCFSVVFQSIRQLNSEELVNVFSFVNVYLLSGAVAFDYLTAIPGSGWFGENTFRFFYAILSSFGADVPVNATILEFVSIPELTNTYTMLYPFYVDFGFVGIGIFALFQGAFYGYLYKKAITGSNMHLLLYAIFSTYIILEYAGEFLFTNASLNLQYLFYAIFPFIINKRIKIL